jgi:RNA polymerase sigma-70 factor (ECF subfamily)
MHPPAPIAPLIADDELERVWATLAAAPVVTAVVGPDLAPSDDAMVAAVIGLGHALGLTVIAEGVETPGQLATTAAGSSLWAEPIAARWCSEGETESVEGRPLDEQELVEQARGGDARAYETLVRRYQDLAFRTAFVIAGGSADAEDAAQEGFVKAWYALPRFRAGSPFRPWLLAIVANEARNRRRSGRRQDDLALRVAEDRPSGDAAPSPEAAALATEQRQLLLAAMGRLGETDRQVIACRYFLELSEAEMAAALGCRPGTVKSRLSRALDRLRAVLAEPGGALAAAPDAGLPGGDR